ncbi:hypothetical protein [Burkholderia contaminans]|uniref:hypothetical protein n=1 Tax=Burkholderia contaminans TaxID=488447 RepID=UPI003D67CE05
MWVLILSVVTSTAPAVASEDFTSQSACLAAADQAAQKFEAASLEAGTKITVRGVCVKK